MRPEGLRTFVRRLRRGRDMEGRVNLRRQHGRIVSALRAETEQRDRRPREDGVGRAIMERRAPRRLQFHHPENPESPEGADDEINRAAAA